MFPIPKYFKNKNITKERDIIAPLLVFAKIVEKVKNKERKKTTKKTGITPKLSGSTK